MRSIRPSGIDGAVQAPPSKSMSVRAIGAAVLCNEGLIIHNLSDCDDAKAALSIASNMGCSFSRDADGSVSFRASSKGKNGGALVLDCNESGLCMRMFPFIAALDGRSCTFTASGSLSRRPMGMVEKPLAMLGASCSTNKGLPPINVKGPIIGGKIGVDGSESSQHITGLLMALPCAPRDSELVIENPKSKPYLSMTLEMLGHFGIAIDNRDFSKFIIKGSQIYSPKKGEYNIEGDWSGASFMLVAGAIAGKVTLSNLRYDSLQADRAIVDALRESGAEISSSNRSMTVSKPGSGLRGFEFDATDCPDIFPPLAVLAINCAGRTILHGASRLRNKESDRAGALISELGKLGARISVNGDDMIIEGSKLKGGDVDSHNDHRIAMACALAALNSESNVNISRPECVSKSYPGFFDELERLMG